MKPVLLKEGEIVVKENDFGFLVEEFVRKILRYNPYVVESIDKMLREWWPMVDEYYQRHIQTDIEVTLELDKDPPPPHSDRRQLPEQHRKMWEKFIADHRPPKAPFTIDYTCSKCKVKGVKLWRQYQTVADAQELVCAKCGAPGVHVDEDGRADTPGFGKTDQIGSWLVPAVPVGDTYWGYTSVPSQDVEWWRKLPTYLPKTDNGNSRANSAGGTQGSK